MGMGVHIAADEGAERRFGPNRIQFKVGRGTGARELSLMTSTFVPGGGYPFLHVHRSFEEMFYVVSGELEYQLGDARIWARAGSTIFIPAGIPHCFKGIGTEPVSIVVIYSSPDGVQMIEDITAVEPDPKKHAEIFERYDSSLIAESSPT
jgi:quercetin dioxygenase-like cupin family protein